MPYLDEHENEIGGLAETRGWIEATGYTGELYNFVPGYPKIKCSWQFARQWWQSLGSYDGLSERAFRFIQKHEGNKE